MYSTELLVRNSSLLQNLFSQPLFFLDARLLEITEQRLNPPHAPTPVQEPHINGQEQLDETPAPLSAATEPDVAIAAGAIPSNSSSFHFMQESELETPSFEDGAEWVEHSEALGHEEPQPEVEVTSVTIAVEEQLVNGHVVSMTQEVHHIFYNPQMITLLILFLL